MRSLLPDPLRRARNGRWICFPTEVGAGVDAHVIPTRGSYHEATPLCWCRPEVEVGRFGRKIVHREAFKP